MKPSVIYLVSRPAIRPERSRWTDGLEAEGFGPILVEATSRAVAMLRADDESETVGVLTEIEAGEADLQAVEELRAAACRAEFPLIGLAVEPTPPALALRLASAGLTSLLSIGAPLPFGLAPIRCYAALAGLKRLEAAGAESRLLAVQTRKLLHELSQPLSALQGRLQLMHAKLDAAEPLRGRVGELADLALETSKLLRELQELHRRYC